MAGQHTLFQPLKLMAGTALIGLGVFLLLGNLSAAAAQLSHLLGISAAAAKTLGVLTAVGLAAPHALPVYLFDHQAFLRSLCQISISFWPLLVVMAGTILLRDRLTGEVKELPK